MESLNLIILVLSALLAAGGAYWFIEWKCPTKQAKLLKLQESLTDSVNEINEEDLKDIAPSEIKEFKKHLDESIKEAQKLAKEKKEDARDADEQAKIDNLPVALEAQSLLSEVKDKADLQRKVIGVWDYVYAGGIALGLFFVGQVVGGLIKKQFDKEG